MNIIKSTIDHGGPYTAMPSGGKNSWWYVQDKTGFNCFSVIVKPGAKFTTEAIARLVATAWNKKHA